MREAWLHTHWDGASRVTPATRPVEGSLPVSEDEPSVSGLHASLRIDTGDPQ